MAKKILEEVRQIASDIIAKKHESEKNNYPKLIEKIKQAAGWGKTQCEFDEHEIGECSKRLLQNDGFIVYATQKQPDTKYDYYLQRKEPKNIWIVSW